MPDFSGSSLATVVGPSQNPTIDPFISGTRFSGPSITFSLPQQGALWASSYPPAHGVDEVANFVPLTQNQQANVRLAIGKWAELINLPIIETADGSTVGDIRASAYSKTATDASAFTYLPAGSPWAGDAWFGPFLANLSDWSPGQLGGTFVTVLHELGHALGLKHPSEGSPVLDPALEDGQHTVMAVLNTPSNYSTAPTTPMVLDVQAIQYIYGANFHTRSGDDVYHYGDEHPYHETIWDGGGNDTIEYGGTLDAQIDLNPGQASLIGLPVTDAAARQIKNVWIAYGATIENATGGAGNDLIVGNDGANRLDGGAGNDRLDGRGGTDTALIGAALSDLQAFSRANGELTLTTSAGTDLLDNIERVRFGDALFAFDTQPTAADHHAWDAAALFRAAFGTLPGIEALSQWTAQADSAPSMGALGQSMLDHYAPGVSPSTLVSYLYSSLVHAPPSAETVQALAGQIGPGRAFATEGDFFAVAASLSLNTDAMVGFVGSIQALDPAWF